MNLFTTVLLAAVLATLSAAQTVEPIWLSPLNVGTYPEDFPPLGATTPLIYGAGSRNYNPLVVMDSKKTLWILLGSTVVTYEYNVWNYDPNTDLYRYAAGPGYTTTDPRNAGALRVPSPNNHPGIVTLTTGTIDHNDNIWFMASTPSSNTGELWMFNTSSLYFTRMKGDHSTTTNPVYGTLGQPSDNVSPGPTYEGCLVVDSLNNLWQIAGIVTSGATNQVWHFNTTSYQWTFFGGNTSNVDTSFNTPLYGARQNQGCDIDDRDRVWLFGGIGYLPHTFNDVWSYDTRTRQWRLEFGSDTSLSANAAVAVADDFNAGNHPAAKIHSSFIDRKDDTLLLVSGTSAVGSTNDIWLFNKTLKQWKLIYGDLSLNNTGKFTHYRTPGSVLPGGRNWHGSTRGLNIDGDVYLHGGQSATSTIVFYNDIWLIPQDQCNSSSANKCSSNARCIEAMIGYSCECKDGFVGDGFNCTGPPISTPLGTPLSPNEPIQSPSNEPTPLSEPQTSPSTTTPLASPPPSNEPLQSPISLPTSPSSSSPLSNEPSHSPSPSPAIPLSSTTPHRDTLVSRGVIESSLFTVISLVIFALVSFC